MAEITDLSNTDINKISIDDLESTAIEQFEIDKLINIPLIKGLSAYQIAVLNGFVGTEQQWLDSLKVEFQASANAFLEEAKENEETRKDNELLRIENEDTRTNNENTRIETENTRIEAEETRISNEEARQDAEAKRVSEFDEIKNTYTEERIITIENNVADLENNKVDKVEGKGLSTNDFTDTLLTKLNGIATGATKNTVTDSLTSTSTTSALSANQGKVLNDKITNKVDKVSGKGLSTNDFTSTYKTKLDGIATGANKTTVTNSLTSTSTTNALSAYQGKVLNEKILGYVVVEEWEG